MSMRICDFCCKTIEDGVKGFTCHKQAMELAVPEDRLVFDEFGNRVLGVKYDEWWLACPSCYHYVQTGNLTGLAVVAAHNLQTEWDDEDGEVADFVDLVSFLRESYQGLKPAGDAMRGFV